MKLVKHTTSDFGTTDIFGNVARSNHWGRTHYFLIENASAEELEAIEDMLAAKGWESDGCPCYEDGFTSGFHIDIEEVDAFKADYKAAKKGLKAYMAAQAEAAAVEVAEEAAHVETVMAEEAEAIEAAHTEALAIDEEINAIVEYAGDRAPLQMDGDVNWIFDTAVSVWRLARAAANQAKEAEQLEQYGAILTAAQQDYNAAQLATVAALDAACAASPDGLDDTPEFTAYEATEATLTEKTTALLQACGRYSVELARKLGRPIADVEALKTMFLPFYTGNTGSVHPGRVNELVSKALQIDVSATQAR